MGFQKLSGGFQKRLKGMGFLGLHSTRIKKKKTEGFLLGLYKIKKNNVSDSK